MKKQLLPLVVAMLLAACQIPQHTVPLPTSTTQQIQHIWQNMPQNLADFHARTANIRQAAQGKRVEQTLYFDADWQPVAQADPQGYYRQSYGLQDNGLYLMQDFYANGNEQTSLFYGTQPENSSSTSARGYLALYTPSGSLDMVWHVVSDNFYHVQSFCGNDICVHTQLQDTQYQETFLKAGKILAHRLSQDNIMARYEAFYTNGKPAYIIEAHHLSDPKTFRLSQQYYLPTGEKIDAKPQNEEFAALEREVLAIEKHAENREVEESAWQDAIDGYPLLQQQIQSMRDEL